MKRYLKANSESFTTFELHHVDQIFASHRFISELEKKQKFSDELFQFIDEAYDELGGFRSFRDMDRFINDSYLWYITYRGPQPIESELELDRVYVVSVFRKNHGLKMVGMARRKILDSTSTHETNMEVRRDANSALVAHIKFTSKVGWAEVSDKLEEYFYRTSGVNQIIDPYTLRDNKIFQTIEVDIDEMHYYRPLRKGGQLLRKIAFGTLRV